MKLNTLKDTWAGAVVAAIVTSVLTLSQPDYTLMWVFTGAAAGWLVHWLTAQRFNDNQIETHQDYLNTPTWELASTIAVKSDPMMKIMQPEPETAPGAEPPRLDQNFRGIIAWLQTHYDDVAADNAPQAPAYQRRIRQLLHSYGYRLVDYNGSNNALFEIQPGNSIAQTEQTRPAVVVEDTGELVAKGLVFIPQS